MNIQNHCWGESLASDRVWAEVSGYGPRIASGRLLMNLQAVIDVSQDAGGGYMLAGYIASADAWANISKEWDMPSVLFDRIEGAWMRHVAGVGGARVYIGKDASHLFGVEHGRLQRV